jgi:transcriptional regulator with XRE-family HTH domain
MDIDKVGAYIQELRKRKNITQKELGERLNISYQAVSKWERGECFPDTALLIDLANILETSVDNVLNGGEKLMDFNKKIYVKDIKNGIENLSNLGNLIGKDNTVYIGMVEGINNKMNINLEECLSNPFKKEALVAEIIVQDMMNGAYADISDIKSNIEHEHWLDMICDYAKRYGIK